MPELGKYLISPCDWFSIKGAREKGNMDLSFTNLWNSRQDRDLSPDLKIGVTRAILQMSGKVAVSKRIDDAGQRIGDFFDTKFQESDRNFFKTSGFSRRH